MNAKKKLQLARSAMYFLERAILDLEQPGRLPRNDTDFDLWHAFHDLKQINDAAEAEQVPEFNADDSEEVQQLIRQG